MRRIHPEQLGTNNSTQLPTSCIHPHDIFALQEVRFKNNALHNQKAWIARLLPDYLPCSANKKTLTLFFLSIVMFPDMLTLIRRAFKVNGCLGSFFGATNGILQGCALSAIFINVLMTIWMKQGDEMGHGCVVQVRNLPPRPRNLDEVRRGEPDTRKRQLTVTSIGYADDCYPIRNETIQLKQPLEMTTTWLGNPGQVINAPGKEPGKIPKCTHYSHQFYV